MSDNEKLAQLKSKLAELFVALPSEASFRRLRVGMELAMLEISLILSQRPDDGLKPAGHRPGRLDRRGAS